MKARARAGNTVILDMSNGKQTFVKLRDTGSSAKLGKTLVALDALLDKEYGSLFELAADGHQLRQVDRDPDIECQDWTASPDNDRSNKTLEDGGAAHQQLSSEDICELRQAGKSGEEIVSALLANSATYSTKTQFSQEKYRRKKARKYVLQLTLRQVTARSVCETYFSKAPAKICWMRSDSLAILLSLANIGAHAQVLLVDATGGLVTAAVAERMGGHGSIVVAHTGARADPSDIVDKFNFPAGTKQKIARQHINNLLQFLPGAQSAQPAAGLNAEQPTESTAVPMDVSSPAATPSHAATLSNADPGCLAGHSPTTQERGQALPEEQAVPASAVQQDTASGCARNFAPAAAQVCPEPAAGASLPDGAPPPRPQSEAATASETDTVGAALPGDGGALADGVASAVQDPAGEEQGVGAVQAPTTGGSADPPSQGQLRAAAQAELQARVARGFDCCILAAPHTHPQPLLEKALPLLKPSAVFAVFSNWSQPLAEAMHQLQVTKQAVGLALQEPWLREHQVLPGRTHPQMTTSLTGGYILSGIKTSSS